MKKILLILSMAGVVISCCGNRNITTDDWANLKGNPQINITPMEDYIELSFLLSEIYTGKVENSFIDCVQSVSFYSMENGKIIDSTIISDTKKIQTPYEKNKILYNLRENYKFYFNAIPKNLIFKVKILTKTSQYIKEIVPDLSIYNAITKSENLELTPSYSTIANGNIEFMLQAKRIKIADEYLPNSESFRVEIFNLGGKMLFSSDYQMNYLQVIGEVEPKNIGEIHTYKYTWNRTDNNKQKIPTGKYRAILCIPAKPNHYTSTINFEIK